MSARMSGSPFSAANAFAYLTLQLAKFNCAQSPDVDTQAAGSSSSQSVIGATSGAVLPSMTGPPVATVSGTVSTFRPIFTVPPEADIGATLIPNIVDP